MSRVLLITDEARPKSLAHRLLLALLIYIFNFHNQPQLLARHMAANSRNVSFRHPYLEILTKVALELSCPSLTASDPTTALTEREVTLWTMVAIGSASCFSPWRLEIPFMGHLIEWMDDDDAGGEEITNTAMAAESRKPTNLDQLTACLRGYYLYGADKQKIRTLPQYKEPAPSAQEAAHN